MFLIWQALGIQMYIDVCGCRCVHVWAMRRCVLTMQTAIVRRRCIMLQVAAGSAMVIYIAATNNCCCTDDRWLASTNLTVQFRRFRWVQAQWFHAQIQLLPTRRVGCYCCWAMCKEFIRLVWRRLVIVVMVVIVVIVGWLLMVVVPKWWEI